MGLGVTRYPMRRALILRRTGEEPRIAYEREERLGVLRPSLGARLRLGTYWEVGLRGSLYLYSEDPLSAGQFSPEEQQALADRYAQVAEDRPLEREFVERLYRDLGSTVASRLAEVNAVTGLPSAPVQFEVKPSVTWRLGPIIRWQLSYAFARYVPGQGVGHVVSTRWTFRLGEPFRLWASLALQVDVLPEATPLRTGLGSLGAEYSF
jgi:hypothetical protein